MTESTAQHLNPFADVIIDLAPADGHVQTFRVDPQGLTGGRDLAGLQRFRDHSEGLLPALFAMSPVDPADGPLVDQLYTAALETARDHKARGIRFTDRWGASVEVRVVYFEPSV